MRTCSRASVFGLMIIALLIGCSEEKKDFVEPVEFGSAQERLVGHDFALADSVFAALAVVDSTARWGRLGRGIVLESQLQYWEAAEEYYAVLEQEPGFTPVYPALARVLIKLGWPGKAVMLLESGLDQTGDKEALSLPLAEALIWVGQPEAVLDLASRGSEDKQQQAALKLYEASAHGMLGDFSSARSALAAVVGQTEFNSAMAKAAALYYETMSQPDSALIFSRLELKLGGSSPLTLVEHFDRALRLTDFYEARKIIEKIPDDSSSATLKNVMKINYFLARDEVVQAFVVNRFYQQEATETISGQAVNLIIKSRLADMVSAERNIEMIEQILRVLQHPPAYKELVNDQILAWFPDLRLAKEAYNRLKKIDSTRVMDQEYRLLKTYVNLAAGDFEKYEELKAEYVDDYSDSPADLTRLAYLVGHKSAYYSEKGIEFYREILDKSPSFRPALVGLTNMLMRLRRFEAAAEVFESYPTASEGNALLIARHATALAESPSSATGWDLLKPLLGRLGGNLFVADRYLQALWKRDQQQLAKEVIDEIIRLWPENPDALTIAAEWSAIFGDYQATLQLSEKAIGLPYSDRSSRIQQANALYFLDQEREALQLFSELEKEIEADPELYLYYSKALAAGKSQPRKAGNLARGAIVDGKRMLRALLNLGFVYIQQKRGDLAVGQARHATNLFPDHPRAFFALGKAAYIEKRDETKEYLTEALRLGLQGQESREAQKMLGNL